MNLFLLLSGIAVYLVCSALAYGISFAYWQGKYPRAEENYRDDVETSLLIAPFGPLSLVVVFCLSGLARYGVKFR